MNNKLSRRHFLSQAAAITTGFAGLHYCVSHKLYAAPEGGTGQFGFGPLVDDPGNILDLPNFFRYKVFSTQGETMDDGLKVPALHDGMAAFPGPDSKTLLVRNHEVNDDSETSSGAFGDNYELLSSIDTSKLYDLGQNDQARLGGTSTLLYNTQSQELEGHFLSLAGTIRNCAGGPTPWNSWITCEETVQRAGGERLVDHGYNFDVPAAWDGTLHEAVALTAMGRFNHEAVAVDPASGIVYQTEDDNEGLIYRFIPTTPGTLSDGGVLQALVVKDQASLDTRNWNAQNVPVGQVLDVEWITMDNVESPDDDLRLRGFNAGAARFARGEGMWYGNDAVYFACTNGGSARKGQIWRYIPSPVEGQAGEASQPGKLELFIEPNDGNLIDNADNLTVAPWGDVIVCEDGGGEQFLVGVTPQGNIYKLARNAGNTSEFAGVTFSPDGSTLFVNIQKAGQTLAITGPWNKRNTAMVIR
jgi:secreted PhoX family phosphatase